MPGAGCTVTRDAREAAHRIGGVLNGPVKALANRRNRRRVKQEIHLKGVDADVTTRLYTGWDVI